MRARAQSIQASSHIIGSTSTTLRVQRRTRHRHQQSPERRHAAYITYIYICCYRQRKYRRGAPRVSMRLSPRVRAARMKTATEDIYTTHIHFMYRCAAGYSYCARHSNSALRAPPYALHHLMRARAEQVCRCVQREERALRTTPTSSHHHDDHYRTSGRLMTTTSLINGNVPPRADECACAARALPWVRSINSSNNDRHQYAATQRRACALFTRARGATTHAPTKNVMAQEHGSEPLLRDRRRIYKRDVGAQNIA